jgi:hypothetical protein
MSKLTNVKFNDDGTVSPIDPSKPFEYSPTPTQRDDGLAELLDKMGDICHEHYLGTGKKTAHDDWEYCYDTEVVFMLQDERIKQALAAHIRRAERAARLDENWKTLEYVTLNHHDTTVGRETEEFLEQRLAALRKQGGGNA